MSNSQYDLIGDPDFTRLLQFELLGLGFLVAYFALEGQPEAAAGFAAAGAFASVGYVGARIVAWLAVGVHARWIATENTEVDG